MIRGVVVEYGLVLFVLIALVGGWAILTVGLAVIRKYDVFKQYLENRKKWGK